MPHGAISISPPKTLRMLTPVPDEGRHDDGLSAALAGLTGIDFLDAWMRELVATGYLHNRARMWMAAIRIFTLCLRWEVGADLLMRDLHDGDPAPKTVSWRRVAGLPVDKLWVYLKMEIFYQKIRKNKAKISY